MISRLKKALAALTSVVLFMILFLGRDQIKFLSRWHLENMSADVMSPEDIFVSIKTSGKLHDTRVKLILKTWWNGIKHQAYFFTDVDDQHLSNMTDGHVVNTKCGADHVRIDLCCKMEQEYEFFFNSRKRWWCHFDDDNYVNPSMLLDVLREYDWRKPYYIGRPNMEGYTTRRYKKIKVYLQFGTGGAGICITRSMGELMSPWMRNGSFVNVCHDLSQSDDVAFGFIVTNRLGLNLTRRNDFNSHIQDLQLIPRGSLFSQVVLSYSQKKRNGHINVINLTDESSPFPSVNDPSRILSYHCLKYPYTAWCPKKES